MLAPGSARGPGGLMYLGDTDILSNLRHLLRIPDLMVENWLA